MVPFAAFLAGLVATGSARAAEPIEQLRGHINRVLAVLSDPHLQKETKTKDRRAAVRKIGRHVFDLEEMSMRALAWHWQARTPAGRQEFSQLFFALLEHGYVGKIERDAEDLGHSGPPAEPGGMSSHRRSRATETVCR